MSGIAAPLLCGGLAGWMVLTAMSPQAWT